MIKIIFAGVLAGLMKAMMDTIRFHGNSWIFEWVLHHLGHKAYWWLKADWKPTWSPLTHWIVGDGWHVAQNIMWLAVFCGIFLGGSWRAVFYFYFGWAIAFNLFFSVIFNKRQK